MNRRIIRVGALLLAVAAAGATTACSSGERSGEAGAPAPATTAPATTAETTLSDACALVGISRPQAVRIFRNAVGLMSGAAFCDYQPTEPPSGATHWGGNAIVRPGADTQDFEMLAADSVTTGRKSTPVPGLGERAVRIISTRFPDGPTYVILRADQLLMRLDIQVLNNGRADTPAWRREEAAVMSAFAEAAAPVP